MHRYACAGTLLLLALPVVAGAAEAQYSKSPDAVRRIIVRATSPGLSAFSDAFRLGGDT